MTLAFENPILAKELRTRMRGARAFWILFSFLSTLSAILCIAYFTWSQNANDTVTAFSVGRQFYMVLFMLQAALVGLITPALTAGTLSIEREQRTYEALAVSCLSRKALVLGKLFSALAFVVLLLTATLPLTAISFLLGGVSPGEVGAAYILLTASAFLYGATGLAYSSFAKSTASSTVLTYGTILLFFGATLPLTIQGAFDFGNHVVGRACMVAVNPVGAMYAATTTENYFGFAAPAWLTALSVNVLLGVLLTGVALHRIEYPRSDRSPLLRTLSAAFVTLVATLVFSSLLHNRLLGNPALALAVAGCILLAIPAVLIPLFATGERLPDQGRFLALRRGDPVSGLTFGLGLTALACSIAGACRLASGDPPASIVPACALTLAVALGFGGFALWVTRALQTRWSALAVTLATLGVLYALPLTSHQTYQRSPMDYLALLSPVAGVLGAAYPDAWTVAPFWPLTAAFYLLAGAAFLTRALRRR